jgi:putative DNA primase/helicase
MVRPEAQKIDRNAAPSKNGDSDAHAMQPNCTDVGNGLRLARQHGKDLRFCFPWGKWLVYDGRRWRNDDQGRIVRLAKECVKAIYREAVNLPEERRATLIKHAIATESRSSRIKAMVEMARSENGIPILPDELDRDAWVLNVGNGTIDLRTGTLRPHDRSDLITKLAPVSYLPNAQCKEWQRFVNAIFKGQNDLIDFVQKLIGYCLTGDVREQIFSIFHGVGANGKSTLLDVLLELLGPDYSMKAAPELLLAKQGESHPTERADLHGKRLVVAIETDEGRRLAESLVKELTGGDRIRARRMREDFWQFSPSHKIILATNHKPTIRGTDLAIWRRVRLVPFEVTFAEHEQDKTLPGKLRSELPGILAWAIQGCLKWQREGLGQPEAILRATREYRSEQDVLGAFLGECCIVSREVRCKASDLYGAYVAWCKRCGEKEAPNRDFGMALSERNFERYTSNGTWYRGLAPRPSTEPTEGAEGDFPISA